MQSIGNGLGALLAQQEPGVRLQFTRQALDLVKLGDQCHRLARDLAAIERVRLEQFPAGMRHAQRGRDALGGQRVIARIVVGDQCARKALEHAPRMLARAAGAKVEQHRTRGYEIARSVHPDIGPFGLAAPRRQQRQRRLVGMHHALADDESLQCLGQRL